MSKKKKGLNLSTKLKYKKPSKKLSYLDADHLTFKNTRPVYGRFAVQAMAVGAMTKNQIEALRVAFRRPLKRYVRSRVWVLLKPDRIITKRSSETRMGRGKGAPIFQVALIHIGQILFEIQGPTVTVMRTIFAKARKKFPIPVSLVSTTNVTL